MHRCKDCSADHVADLKAVQVSHASLEAENVLLKAELQLRTDRLLALVEKESRLEAEVERYKDGKRHWNETAGKY